VSTPALRFLLGRTIAAGNRKRPCDGRPGSPCAHKRAVSGPSQQVAGQKTGLVLNDLVELEFSALKTDHGYKTILKTANEKFPGIEGEATGFVEFDRLTPGDDARHGAVHHLGAKLFHEVVAEGGLLVLKCVEEADVRVQASLEERQVHPALKYRIPVVEEGIYDILGAPALPARKLGLAVEHGSEDMPVVGGEPPLDAEKSAAKRIVHRRGQSFELGTDFPPGFNQDFQGFPEPCIGLSVVLSEIECEIPLVFDLPEHELTGEGETAIGILKCAELTQMEFGRPRLRGGEQSLDPAHGIHNQEGDRVLGAVCNDIGREADSVVGDGDGADMKGGHLMDNAALPPHHQPLTGSSEEGPGGCEQKLRTLNLVSEVTIFSAAHGGGNALAGNFTGNGLRRRRRTAGLILRRRFPDGTPGRITCRRVCLLPGRSGCGGRLKFPALSGSGPSPGGLLNPPPPDSPRLMDELPGELSAFARIRTGGKFQPPEGVHGIPHGPEHPALKAVAEPAAQGGGQETLDALHLVSRHQRAIVALPPYHRLIYRLDCPLQRLRSDPGAEGLQLALDLLALVGRYPQGGPLKTEPQKGEALRYRNHRPIAGVQTQKKLLPEKAGGLFHRLLGEGPALRQHDEVVGVPDKPEFLVLRGQKPVEGVKVEIGKEGGDHPALTDAGIDVAPTPPGIHSTHLEPQLDEPRHGLILENPAKASDEALLVEGTEEVVDIRCDDPFAPSVFDIMEDSPHRLLRSLAWPVPVTAIAEAPIKDGFDNSPNSLLRHFVTHRGESKDAFFLGLGGFGNRQTQEWLGYVRLGREFLVQLLQPVSGPGSEIFRACAVDPSSGSLSPNAHPGRLKVRGLHDAGEERVVGLHTQKYAWSKTHRASGSKGSFEDATRTGVFTDSNLISLYICLEISIVQKATVCEFSKSIWSVAFSIVISTTFHQPFENVNRAPRLSKIRKPPLNRYTTKRFAKKPYSNAVFFPRGYSLRARIPCIFAARRVGSSIPISQKPLQSDSSMRSANDTGQKNQGFPGRVDKSLHSQRSKKPQFASLIESVMETAEIIVYFKNVLPFW